MPRLYLDRLHGSDQYRVLDAVIRDLTQAKANCPCPRGRARLQKTIRHYERRWDRLAGHCQPVEQQLLQAVSDIRTVDKLAVSV